MGLDYLTLARSACTLSGGEAQRIRLATQIGSSLVGVLYILDEPSIGLHQRDNRRLLNTLCHLRDLGNTLIVVEHDEETMLEADYIVDVGPGAGVNGGHIVAAGTPAEIIIIRSADGPAPPGERSVPFPPGGARPRNAHHPRCTGEQPQERHRGHTAGRNHLRHRRFRQRQVLAGERGFRSSPFLTR